MNTELARGLLGDMGDRVPDRLIEFGRALSVANPLDWPYFLSNPWKWADEYASWANHDYPVTDDPDWEAFLAELPDAGSTGAGIMTMLRTQTRLNIFDTDPALYEALFRAFGEKCNGDTVEFTTDSGVEVTFFRGGRADDEATS